MHTWVAEPEQSVLRACTAQERPASDSTRSKMRQARDLRDVSLPCNADFASRRIAESVAQQDWLCPALAEFESTAPRSKSVPPLFMCRHAAQCVKINAYLMEDASGF